jgi:protein-tyrosine phosphatase
VTHIAMHGALNIRDLGGIATRSGAKISPGRVFRSDALSKLTDEDVATLAGLALRTAIDFRSTHEVAGAGPDRLPAGAAAIALPVDAANLEELFAADPATLSDLVGGGKGVEFMLGINRQFVADPALRAQFGRALHLIADPDRQPALFHCTVGKDRTGWMAAILLTALGVSRDAVTADYLATNDYVWPAYQVILDGHSELLALVKPLLVQDPAYLDAAFDEVDARYGSFGEFLTDGLDFAAADVERLRDGLLS